MQMLASSADAGCGLVTAAFVVVAIAVAVAWSAHHKTACRRAVEDAVRVYGGEVVPGDWLTQDHATFDLLGVPARLTWHQGSKNSPAYTRLEFGLSSRGVLRVRPEGLFATVRKWFGAQDIEVGDPDVDALFIIEGKPEQFAKAVLTAEVRRMLVDWVQAGVLLNVQPGQTVFQVGRLLPPSVELLKKFIEDARKALEGVRGHSSGETGVKVLEVVLAEGDCPTCGAPLAGALASCAKCGTQQHVECWNYLGKCATYACGSMRKK